MITHEQWARLATIDGGVPWAGAVDVTHGEISGPVEHNGTIVEVSLFRCGVLGAFDGTHDLSEAADLCGEGLTARLAALLDRLAEESGRIVPTTAATLLQTIRELREGDVLMNVYGIGEHYSEPLHQAIEAWAAAGYPGANGGAE